MDTWRSIVWYPFKCLRKLFGIFIIPFKHLTRQTTWTGKPNNLNRWAKLIGWDYLNSIWMLIFHWSFGSYFHYALWRTCRSTLLLHQYFNIVLPYNRAHVWHIRCFYILQTHPSTWNMHLFILRYHVSSFMIGMPRSKSFINAGSNPFKWTRQFIQKVKRFEWLEQFVWTISGIPMNGWRNQ